MGPRVLQRDRGHALHEGRRAGQVPQLRRDRLRRRHARRPLRPRRPWGDMSAEKSKRGLAVEINNGRAAMLGIFGFMAASKIDGSVPALSFIKPYAGNYMSPFEGNYDLFA